MSTVRLLGPCICVRRSTACKYACRSNNKQSSISAIVSTGLSEAGRCCHQSQQDYGRGYSGHRVVMSGTVVCRF